MSEFKVINNDKTKITKLFSQKITVEIDDTERTLLFWQTKYTFHEIAQIVWSNKNLLKLIESYKEPK